MSQLKSYYVRMTSIIIACLGVIVYANTFWSPFHFDDQEYIVNNYAIRSLGHLLDHWRFYPCRFVTFLTFVFNYHFGQLKVEGYHLFNEMVHICCALLVWWLMGLTLATPVMRGQEISKQAPWLAFFAGLVFVSHPVQTEAVTYIWQRTASLAAMFYLASICFYVKSRLLGLEAPGRRLEILCFAVSLLAAIAGMFTKENTVTLPLMVLFYERCFFDIRKTPPGRILPVLLTIFIIPLTIVLTKAEQFQVLQRFTHAPGGTSPFEYLWTQLKVILVYLRLVVFPVGQNLDYDFRISKSLFEGPVLLGFLALAGVIFAGVRLFPKHRPAAFGIGWFLLALSLESSILPLRNVIFEHRLYLPLAGYSIFLVCAVYYLWGRKSIKALVIILTAIVALNSLLTFQRNAVWQSDLALWNDAVQKSPHKARPYNNRGFSYYAEGKIGPAIADYTKAIELDPQMADAYIGRGLCYAKQGNSSRAVADYDKAIELEPQNPQAYNNRGIFYLRRGDVEAAIADLTRALSIDPYYAQAYYNRGLAYAQQRDYALAIPDYEQAMALDPNYTDACYNLGLAFARSRYTTQAVFFFSKAIALNPYYADAYNNRGIVLAQQGKFDQAVADFNRAIKLNPPAADAYCNRGNVYHLQGKLTEALADYDKAIQLNPHDAQAYHNRGNLYFMLGQKDKALMDLRKTKGF